jgi:hypothetical protein
MVSQDYDLVHSRISVGLGAPWFHRRHAWQLSSSKQFQWAQQNLTQAFEDSPKTLDFDKILIIEVAFDSPLTLPVDTRT